MVLFDAEGQRIRDGSVLGKLWEGFFRHFLGVGRYVFQVARNIKTPKYRNTRLSKSDMEA